MQFQCQYLLASSHTNSITLTVWAVNVEVFTVQGQCGCKISAEQFNIPTLPLCGL